MSSDFFLTLVQLLPRHHRQVVLLVIRDPAFPHDKDDLQPLRRREPREKISDRLTVGADALQHHGQLRHQALHHLSSVGGPPTAGQCPPSPGSCPRRVGPRGSSRRRANHALLEEWLWWA